MCCFQRAPRERDTDQHKCTTWDCTRCYSYTYYVHIKRKYTTLPHNIHPVTLPLQIFPTAADFLLDDSTEIVFQSGFTNSTQCVDIEIVNDATLESSEFFNVVLSSSDPDVVIDNNMASIVIIDDDGMPIFITISCLKFNSHTLYYQRSL